MRLIKTGLDELIESAQDMIDTGYELIDLIAEKYGIYSNIPHIGNTDFGFKKEDFE